MSVSKPGKCVMLSKKVRTGRAFRPDNSVLQMQIHIVCSAFERFFEISQVECGPLWILIDPDSIEDLILSYSSDYNWISFREAEFSKQKLASGIQICLPEQSLIKTDSEEPPKHYTFSSRAVRKWKQQNHNLEFFAMSLQSVRHELKCNDFVNGFRCLDRITPIDLAYLCDPLFEDAELTLLPDPVNEMDPNFEFASRQLDIWD